MGRKKTTTGKLKQRVLQNLTKPESYLSWCAQAALLDDKSYGRYMADTTEPERRKKWAKCK